MNEINKIILEKENFQMLSEYQYCKIYKLETLIFEMNQVKDVDKLEIKRLEECVVQFKAEVQQLNDNIFEMNHNLNFMKNANTELTNNVSQLDQKYKVQKNKEEFFKNEIKKGLIELNSLRDPIEQ